MILNIFKKLHEDNVKQKRELVASYDEEIRRASELNELFGMNGYKIIKEVINELIESYQASAFDDSQDYDKGKILIAKAAALRELQTELEGIVRLGSEYRQKQQEIIESL